MKDDELDAVDAEIFEGVEQPAQEVATEPTQKEEPAPEVAEASQDALAAAEVPSDEPTPTPEGMMPYGAFASERQKAKERAEQLETEKANAARLQARLDVLEAQRQTAKPAAIPDPLEDTQGYQQYMQGQLKDIQTQARLEISEFKATQMHGEDAVKAATEAALTAMQTQPHVKARIQSAMNPHDEAVKWHREQSFLTETGGDVEAYKARIIAEYQAAQGQPAAAQAAPVGANQTAAKPVIPPSNARIPSAMPNNAEPSFEDIEKGLWGNR